MFDYNKQTEKQLEVKLIIVVIAGNAEKLRHSLE
jgi:hypothetical protein